MAEASLLRQPNDIRRVAEAAVGAFEVQQHCGECCVLVRSSVAAGENAFFAAGSQYTLPTSAGIVLLDGQEVWWDHSANLITFAKNNDRDFYAGKVVGDKASADTTVVVNLNRPARYDLDSRLDTFLSVPTGTQAVGGFGWPKVLGAARLLELTSTNEAQCIDLFSVDRFAKTANAIIECVLMVPTNGSTSAVDFNVGIANGTHTTDADSITEHVLFHIDGGSTTINAQSKDGTTTVAATTTGTTITAGSAVANRVHLMMDTRNTEDVKLYVNCVRVAAASTLKINNATGPFGLLVHAEKTSSTATGQFILERLTARFNEQ